MEDDEEAQMIDKSLTDEVLEWLREVSRAATPPPWHALIEGRDHESGDTFLMIGGDGSRDREDDLYLFRNGDGGLYPARSADFEFVAQSRNYFDSLLSEIQRLRRLNQEAP